MEKERKEGKVMTFSAKENVDTVWFRVEGYTELYMEWVTWLILSSCPEKSTESK